MMKKFVLFLLLCTAAFASASDSEDRLYIDQDQVFLNEEGIFVNIHDDWVAVKQINHDSKGLFVSKEENRVSIFWNCPKCHYDNNFWVKVCGQCGYEPRKNRS